MRTLRSLVLVCALAAIAACGDRDSGTESGTRVPDRTGDASDADGAESDGQPAEDVTRVELGLDTEPDGAVDGDASAEVDVARPDVDAGGVNDLCRDVDILFVIDNSASMSDNQRSVVASFPGFLDAMRERLAFAVSFHVGVVTSDAYRYNAAGCTDIGDLVTATAGLESSNATCGPYEGGTRYIDGLDPNIDEDFACAAQLGVSGDDNERVMRALLNAIDPARNAEGACNAGFLRPDSLLVVVMISDEDDADDGSCGPDDWPCTPNGSGGTVNDWIAELTTLRPSATEDMIVLSLIARYQDSSCGAQQAARLVGFTLRFGERGLIGDICAPSYDAFFLEALPLIDDACKYSE
ncbi:MAG: hypothetical protein H6698_09250 [Myxococcales bacterium]|nr:hypothetical protein [Myxococcales bacterium]MCB9531158.1 hypothetical protein [Myxococcales bacterium]MCB9534472.1 hypothetical protein [Myxococcales bacterium]